MDDLEISRRAMGHKPKGRTRIGRPKLRWMTEINKVLRMLGVRELLDGGEGWRVVEKSPKETEIRSELLFS